MQLNRRCRDFLSTAAENECLSCHTRCQWKQVSFPDKAVSMCLSSGLCLWNSCINWGPWSSMVSTGEFTRLGGAMIGSKRWYESCLVQTCSRRQIFKTNVRELVQRTAGVRRSSIIVCMSSWSIYAQLYCCNMIAWRDTQVFRQRCFVCTVGKTKMLLCFVIPSKTLKCFHAHMIWLILMGHDRMPWDSGVPIMLFCRHSWQDKHALPCFMLPSKQWHASFHALRFFDWLWVVENGGVREGK